MNALTRPIFVQITDKGKLSNMQGVDAGKAYLVIGAESMNGVYKFVFIDDMCAFKFVDASCTRFVRFALENEVHSYIIPGPEDVANYHSGYPIAEVENPVVVPEATVTLVDGTIEPEEEIISNNTPKPRGRR